MEVSLLENIVPLLVGAGITSIGFLFTRYFTKARAKEGLEAVPLIIQAGLTPTRAQMRTAHALSHQLLPPTVVNYDPGEAARAVEAMRLAAEQSDPTNAEVQVDSLDIHEVQHLIEVLLNQLASARYGFRWLFDKLIEFDPADARWPLLKAMNDAQALKTLKFMRLLNTPVIETSAKEISDFPKTVSVPQLRAAYERLAIICNVPEAHRKDVRDALDYWEQAEPEGH
jgi:hypothetical protein